MNAALRKPGSSDDYFLAIGEDVSMDEGFGELRADVRHIQSDATDIKADLRTTNTRLEDLRKEMNTNVQGARNELGKKLDDIAAEMVKGQKEAVSRIENVRVELTGKIDDIKDRVNDSQKELAGNIDSVKGSLQKELAEKIDSVKDSLSQAKVWALGLYISLAGALLLVIAHGFKWL